MPRSFVFPRLATESLFGLKRKKTSVCQEVLAGILGWQTIVSSFEFYASLFLGNEEDVDSDATIEAFLLVAGLSTMAYGVLFNVPFIVAPSVLYAARESGIAIGGHLAAQAAANLAAAFVFSLTLKTNFVSYVPTALRLGAGCGLSMMISVLGMRTIGLLVADSFTLQAPTWKTIVGLLIITGTCCQAPKGASTKKWTMVVLIPFVVTLTTYAITDRTKFRGYFSGASIPLSNWRSGTFGTLDFYHLLPVPPRQLSLYILRVFLSVSINVSSMLLVLIDAVCLEDVHKKVKSSLEEDFSDDISRTKKFRSMACAVPLMSFIGNLMGVTTQAVFVQTMMPVFAGGKSGLTSVVTGGLLLLSTILRPLLPVLAPPHVAGALMMIISLRFFTVVKIIDFQRPINVLMFGMSILLIPFSFQFVDALCITTMLGFVCQTLDTIFALMGSRRGRNKVVVSLAGGHPYAPDTDGGEATAKTFLYDTSNSTSQKVLCRSSTVATFSGKGRSSSHISTEPITLLRDRGGGQADAGKLPYVKGAFPAPDPPTTSVNSSARSWFTSSRNSLSRARSSRSLQVSNSSFRSQLDPRERACPAETASVHWVLAVVASCELTLAAIDKVLRDSDES